MTGRAIYFVFSFFVSGVRIVKALSILDLLRESKVLSAVCTKVAKGTVASKEALTKTLAAEAVSRLKNAATDILNGIKSIIRGEGYYEFIAPDGMIFRMADEELPYSIRFERRVLECQILAQKIF
jgi:hypothetical protein